MVRLIIFVTLFAYAIVSHAQALPVINASGSINMGGMVAANASNYGGWAFSPAISAEGGATASAAASIASADGAVAATVTATYSAARIASIAVATMRIASLAGLAFTAYGIYKAISDSGMKTCPPPQFFCVPSGKYKFGAHLDDDAETALKRSLSEHDTESGCDTAIGDTKGFCGGTLSNCHDTDSGDAVVCDVTGSYLKKISAGKFFFPDGGPDVKASDGDVSDHMKNYAKDPHTARDIMQKLIDDAHAHPELGPSVIPGDLPTHVSAPPVTTVSPYTRTESGQAPDGSPVTRVVTEKVTLTPQTTGDTLATSKTTVVRSVETTTVSTNPITGATSTSTSVATAPSAPAAPSSPAGDTGPKECGSPGHPPCKIDETDTPDGSKVDQDKDLKSIDDQNKRGNGFIESISAQSLGFVASWFPQIPTASCTNPVIPNPLHSGYAEMEICEPVNKFSSFISAVICFYALIASVHCVQSAVKA